MELHLTTKEYEALKEFISMNEFNSERLSTKREIAYTLVVHQGKINPWGTYEDFKESHTWLEEQEQKILKETLSAADVYTASPILSQLTPIVSELKTVGLIPFLIKLP